MEFLQKIMGAVDNITSMIVYVLIAILFIFGFIKCIMPVIHNRATLKRAARSIRTGDKRRSWQEDAFLGRGSMYPHWSEYLNNLFFADGEYHNACNVEDFINEETVIYGPSSSGFAEALPGLMVSLGFMGTLIGLAIGLSGFDMADESAIMGSIETLIPGMRYAFMTSIAGVIASVSFTLITRIVNGSTSRAIEKFYGAMSEYAGVLSVDPMTQVAIYQQEQTAVLQTMVKDLNGEFTQRMSRVIEDSMKPLSESLDRFVTVNTQEQMRFLDTIVTRFVSHMDHALGNQFENLSDIIAKTVRSQEKIIDAMESQASSLTGSVLQIRQVESAVSGMLDRFEDYTAKLNSAQRRSEEAFARAANGFEDMQHISRQQQDYLREISDMHKSISDTVGYLNSCVEALTKAAGSIGAVSERVYDMRREMDLAAERSAQSVARVHGAALEETREETRRVMEDMNGYLQEYAVRMANITEAIGGTVKDLPKSISDVSGELAEQIERLNATFNRAQRAMDDVVDRMYRN